eukprot:CAMPEP_0174836134 /NCGR_PEP_ID=MMETSP1114-20130205/5860_1 /TAXON_ID=312471 /ORGANISM="Neobodo designis, Strain CCAP 1951/1" /LENGTH=48 /DNA_ID= /DNA_START= /DNA_END= /DNA_ORIENTATION=
MGCVSSADAPGGRSRKDHLVLDRVVARANGNTTNPLREAAIAASSRFD